MAGESVIIEELKTLIGVPQSSGINEYLRFQVVPGMPTTRRISGASPVSFDRTCSRSLGTIFLRSTMPASRNTQG